MRVILLSLVFMLSPLYSAQATTMKRLHDGTMGVSADGLRLQAECGGRIFLALLQQVEGEPPSIVIYWHDKSTDPVRSVDFSSSVNAIFTSDHTLAGAELLCLVGGEAELFIVHKTDATQNLILTLGRDGRVVKG